MAYTDPKTGAIRDQYGNEVAHDTSATTRHANSSLPWIVGIVLAAIAAGVIYNMNETNNPSVTTPNDRSITEPLNKAPPVTTP